MTRDRYYCRQCRDQHACTLCYDKPFPAIRREGFVSVALLNRRFAAFQHGRQLTRAATVDSFIDQILGLIPENDYQSRRDAYEGLIALMASPYMIVWQMVPIGSDITPEPVTETFDPKPYKLGEVYQLGVYDEKPGLGFASIAVKNMPGHYSTGWAWVPVVTDEEKRRIRLRLGVLHKEEEPA